MKVLMISPFTGGIDVYVDSLANGLRRLGVNVDVAGSVPDEKAYDVERKKWKTSDEVKLMVEGIADRIDFESYDLVAFHYGKNDIEQYLPVVLKERGIKLKKSVYFVHFLSRNLFDQYLGDKKTKDVVEESVGNFYDGYVFFGTFAKKFMEKQYKKSFGGIVNFLPETHSQEKIQNKDSLIASFLPDDYDHDLPIVFFPGFASNYKDYKLLLSSFELVKNNFLFVFAGQGWQKALSFTNKVVNKVQVFVVDKYLSSVEYKLLSESSLFGIFPYRQPKIKGEFFQGSGTFPNFIYSGKANVVLDEGAMAEYAGESGIVVRDATANSFAKAIDSLFDLNLRIKLENEAKKRKQLFSQQYHAKKCLDYFKKLCPTSVLG